MKRLLLWATLTLVSGGALERSAPADASVHPQVWRLVQNGDRTAVWVFFTDKGITSPDAREQALAQARSELYPRAIQRRTSPGLIDWYDLPVCARYVERVRASGAHERVLSRWLNAVSVTATGEQIKAIAQLPFVRRIEPVRRGFLNEAVPIESMRPAERQTRGFYGLAEEQLAQIRIPDMHAAGYTGLGVVIGVLDTGFKRSHDVSSNPDHPIDVVAEWDFVMNDGDTDYEPDEDPCFDGPHGLVCQYDHGTIVLSTIASYLPDVYVGGAYDASFILAKTEDIEDEYPAEEDLFVAGLEFIEMNGADLATSSLGYSAWYDYFDMDGQTAVATIAVNIATANGLVCCTAIGNGGRDKDYPTLIAPSDAYDVISCGAVNSAGELADFSSNGPTADGRVKPEVLAHGEITAVIDPHDDQAYKTGDGTSLSTPLVASAVALLIQAHPDWTVEQIRTALFHTADYYVANGEYDPLFERGYGLIDVYAAHQWVFCSGDLDGDNDTDQSDLGILLGSWGIDAGGDLDGDGETGQTDLGILLADWGCEASP